MSSNSNLPTETKILDFKSFKQKQETNNEFSRSRKPLYVNNEEGRISGTSQGAKSAADKGEDFGDRLQKIRSSLDRINTLMADLKKLSSNRSKDQLN